MRAFDAQFRVLLAETRRWFQVNQILGTGRFVFRVERFQLETVLVLFLPSLATLRTGMVTMDTVTDAVGTGTVAMVTVCIVTTSLAACVADHHSRCTVETVLQVVADDPEGWQAHPASFDGTGAGHTVTFTLLSHFLFDML